MYSRITYFTLNIFYEMLLTSAKLFFSEAVVWKCIHQKFKCTIYRGHLQSYKIINVIKSIFCLSSNYAIITHPRVRAHLKWQTSETLWNTVKFITKCSCGDQNMLLYTIDTGYINTGEHLYPWVQANRLWSRFKFFVEAPSD